MSEPLLIKAHGSSYRICDPGGHIGEALHEGRPYEGPLLEHIYARGFTGLAVDAGAHVGNHALWLAVVCGLEVIAVEPLSTPELRRNIALNGLEGRVRIWPFALGAREECKGTTGKGRLRGEGEIRVEPLDAADLRGLSLLKVDVEGMEADVLSGGIETIRRERPVIYAEAWDDEAHQRVAEVIEPLGYRHVNTFGATPLEEWEPS
jgi:FkbM family methyltransferase